MQLYEKVTADIIRHLENGVRPWSAGWKSRSMIPFNAAKGVHYRGVNIIVLWAAAIENGYATNAWLGYKEGLALGAKVRRGEKATKGLYVNFIEDEEKKTKRAFAKVFNVFNVAQFEELPVEYSAEPEPLPEGALFDVVTKTGITVRHGQSPCYKLVQDIVEMPNYSDFHSDHDYASALLHELGHATGHPSRLNREMTKEAYAREELIAELTSAFACAALGYSYVEAQSPAYIEHWLGVLKEDSRALFTIASQASKAADWLLKKEAP